MHRIALYSEYLGLLQEAVMFIEGVEGKRSLQRDIRGKMRIRRV